MPPTHGLPDGHETDRVGIPETRVPGVERHKEPPAEEWILVLDGRRTRRATLSALGPTGKDLDAFVRIGAEKHRHHGWVNPGRELQRRHFAGIPLGRLWNVDELLDHHGCAGPFGPPYARSRAASQPASPTR